MGASAGSDRQAFNSIAAERRFAVVDVETTGFNARGSDRVVEVAIVTVDSTGRIHDEFTTLIDPERDVGPTRIHGITATDLIGAPTFREVAGAVAERLEGTVVVAHNVAFDEAFLRSEFARMGHLLPPFPTLCTLRLVSQVGVDSPTRRLSDCCCALGIETGASHAALSDARAAASLLTALLRLAAADGAEISRDVAGASAAGEAAWPKLPQPPRVLVRSARRRPAVASAPFLARIVSSLPHDNAVPPDGTAYLGALDIALADRVIAEDEAEILRDVARACHLTRADAARLQLDYFTSMVRVAFADGTLSPAERSDLEAVGTALGLGSITIESQLATESPVSSRPSVAATSADSARPDSGALRGKLVCFTGELASHIGGQPVSREDAEAIARNAGLQVASGVTRKLGLLVAADPHTKSSKAVRARAYGIPVIGEREFWSTIGVAID